MCLPSYRLAILIHVSFSQLFSECSTNPIAKPISEDGFRMSSLRAEYIPPESISISFDPPTKGFRSKGMCHVGHNCTGGETDDMAVMVDAYKARIVLEECRFDLSGKRKQAHDAEWRVEEKMIDEVFSMLRYEHVRSVCRRFEAGLKS
jgi:hypothetical protein